MQSDEYECASCHGVFKKVRDENWSDEKADEEAKKLWGKGKDSSGMVIICHDCHLLFIKRMKHIFG